MWWWWWGGSSPPAVGSGRWLDEERGGGGGGGGGGSGGVSAPTPHRGCCIGCAGWPVAHLSSLVYLLPLPVHRYGIIMLTRAARPPPTHPPPDQQTSLRGGCNGRGQGRQDCVRPAAARGEATGQSAPPPLHDCIWFRSQQSHVVGSPSARAIGLGAGGQLSCVGGLRNQAPLFEGRGGGGGAKRRGTGVACKGSREGGWCGSHLEGAHVTPPP